MLGNRCREVLDMSRAGYYAAQRRLRQPKKTCVVRALLKSEFESKNFYLL